MTSNNHAHSLHSQLIDDVCEIVMHNAGLRPPSVHLVTVGSHPTAQLYADATEAAAKACAIPTHRIAFPADTTSHELASLLRDLDADDSVSGIVLQLPLPEHLADENLSVLISDLKDIDGLKQRNVECFLKDSRLWLGSQTSSLCANVTPAIVVACEQLFDALRSDGSLPPWGERASVALVGIPPPIEWPLRRTFELAGCDVVTGKAGSSDLVILGDARAGDVTARSVRSGCIIIDLGVSSCAPPTAAAAAAATAASATASSAPTIFDNYFGQPEPPAKQWEATGEAAAVRVICARDGVASVTAALRMRNACNSAMMAQGYYEAASPPPTSLWYRPSGSKTPNLERSPHCPSTVSPMELPPFESLPQSALRTESPETS